jgi:protocatechuate 3,4-dioxygenase beta subunit
MRKRQTRLALERLEHRAVPSMIGVVDPATETWHLSNAASENSPSSSAFPYGLPGWIPVAGDWSGNGTTGIGVFDPATATWYLRNSDSAGAPDVTPFQYGLPGWTPVVGDWNGGGKTTVGVVDPTTGTWYLRNSNSGGAPDVTPFQYGLPGWKPVVGDWNGDGKTTVGVVDPTTGTWYLRNSNSAGAPDVTPFQYGLGGWTPVVGDWNGGGKTTAGVIDPTTGTWYLRNTNGGGAPDYTAFPYGLGGWVPVAGNWSGGSTVRPSLAVTGPTVTVGSSGTATADFVVNLSAASASTVTVNYATSDGTAAAGTDYTATSGTLTFAPGVTALAVPVTVIGDATADPNETFTLTLSNPTNATLSTASAVGTIITTTSTATLTPAVTQGPYFQDFTDAALNRSDITSGTTRTSVVNGVPLTLTLNVYQVSGNTVTPLTGARVDVWHADAIGVYSDETSEGTAGQTFLRGYQSTDANGSVTFHTIIPGWYAGRAPHLHFMVRTASSSGSLTDRVTSQLFFDQTLIDTIYTGNAPYSARGNPDTSNASDMVYNTTTSSGGIAGPQLLLTLTPTGNGGYAATFNVYVAAS